MNMSLYSTRYTERLHGDGDQYIKEGTFLVDMSEGADDGDKRKESLSDLVFWTLHRRDESRGSQSR